MGPGEPAVTLRALVFTSPAYDVVGGRAQFAF